MVDSISVGRGITSADEDVRDFVESSFRGLVLKNVGTISNTFEHVKVPLDQFSDISDLHLQFAIRNWNDGANPYAMAFLSLSSIIKAPDKEHTYKLDLHNYQGHNKSSLRQLRFMWHY